MSIRRLLLSLPLLILVIIASAWFWLLHTQSGAQWIWSRVESAADGSLSAASITGNLSSGLVAGDVTFIGDSVNVFVGQTSLSVDIDLLPLKVNVLSASVSDLRIDLAADDRAEDDTNLHDTLNKLQLPVELAFEAIALDGGVINGIDQEWSFVVNSLSAAGTWADEIALHRVDLDAPLVNASGSGSLSLLDQHDVQLDVELLAKPELTTLDDAIPVTATVKGPLDNLVVQARADEPRAFLHSRLARVTDSLRWEARLDLPALALPPKAGGPDIPPLELVCGRRIGNDRPFLEVRDRGPGIPPDIRDRVFEPFFRGSPGQRAGTGLGLFISRELCECNRAALVYEPRHGGGSIFRIIFADPLRWEP